MTGKPARVKIFSETAISENAILTSSQRQLASIKSRQTRYFTQ
jgi:hypothetical protein